MILERLDNKVFFKRAIEIVRYKNISPEEWEQAKIETSKRKVIMLEREEERSKIAKNLITLGIDNSVIAKATGLTVEQIEGIGNDQEKSQ